MSAAEIGAIFAEWNKGELDSYLIEITAEILTKTDGETGTVVDNILDTAGQKGTGKWTGTHWTWAYRRHHRRGRVRPRPVRHQGGTGGGQESAERPRPADAPDKDTFVERSPGSVRLQNLLLYPGLSADAAAAEYDWDLNFGSIAQMWRGGCIIRAAFLDDIKAAFDANPAGQPAAGHLLYRRNQAGPVGWRQVVAARAPRGLGADRPSALSYYDGYRSERLPPTCCRPSAIISARTPTSGSTSLAASLFTPTGRGAAAARRAAPTTPEMRNVGGASRRRAAEQLTLAIETATPYLALGLSGPQGRWTLLSEVGRAHAEQLPAALTALLEEAQLPKSAVQRLVIGTGPGSYTGVRVGASYALGLGRALGVPGAGRGHPGSPDRRGGGR